VSAAYLTEARGGVAGQDSRRLYTASSDVLKDLNLQERWCEIPTVLLHCKGSLTGASLPLSVCKQRNPDSRPR
jgi:hypothetical protein